MSRVSLDSLRACLEGAIPGVMATCGADGVPNVTYISQVEYVDADHLALSFQFFNKTRRNVLDNPQVELLVVHPADGTLHRIAARYLRTETEGALFERMKAKLAGIASHTGMAGVFRLRGADVYVVQSIDSGVQSTSVPPPAAASGPNRLAALRRAGERLARCVDVPTLLDGALDALAAEFDVRHAMLLLAEGSGQRLYTVASRGYARSGAGSEIEFGQGVIGVAAAQRSPIRINHSTLDHAYARAMRDAWAAGEGEGSEGGGTAPPREIPFPGLSAPGSQLALPLLAADQLLGVLFVESALEMRFSWDDEDALAALAAQLAAQLRAAQLASRQGDEELIAAGAPAPRAPADAQRAAAPTAPVAAPGAAHPIAAPADGRPLRVRHYALDGSVFFDDDYLIKGVAGAVLWKLLRHHVDEGRCDFTNRELRLAPELRLPEVGDNLEARLLLLARRLVDRDTCVRIERTGRGRFRLAVGRPLRLEHIAR